MDTAYRSQSEEPTFVDSLPVDDYVPIFYVGHHESRRPLPVTELMLRQAQDAGVSSTLISLHSRLTVTV
jgi:hypothetical protein